MNIRNVFLITLSITVVVSLICISLFPSVQDFMEYNTTWNGIRRSLNELDAKTVETAQEIPETPVDDVLVVIPYVEYDSDGLAVLKDFIDEGGTLVVMDDYGYGNNILEYLGIDCRFSGGELLDPLFCYKNQWLPKITDFASDVSQEVELVILNHAAALLNTEASEVIAWSSRSSYLDDNGNGTQDEGETEGPLPVAAGIKVSAGEVILVSDPSILINSMLGRDDNLVFFKDMIDPEAEDRQVLIDTSHLEESPLDTTKLEMAVIKDVLSQPYALLGIVAVLLIFASGYAAKNGGSIGREL